MKDDLMDKLVSLCKRRGFVFPGSEIYGGLANSWDYGPLGVELKNNIKQEWWRRFVQARSDVVGIDAAIMMNPKVWAASGHVSGFSDPLVECKKCHERFRADQIAGVCPGCGSKSLTEPKQFNLLFPVRLGATEDSSAITYLRGENAQAMFVNFKQVLETTRKRLPFGIASQGRAFRNEITPGNFIFRTREFDLMELEYFVRPADWEKHFAYWLTEMKQWLKDLGVAEKKLHFVEVPEGERAHYSKRTVDIEYDYPFGQKELYGLSYRGDFDLSRHQEVSGQDLRYSDGETGAKFLPHVIEPTFGLDRSVLVVMLEAYHEEAVPTLDGGHANLTKGETDKRVVLRFPRWLAPIKVAVLPLSKKAEITAVAKHLYEQLVKKFVCEYDETQSIGKRYRRQDEVGTPFCVTVDFDSLEDQAVTVRERDSMRQERIKITELEEYLKAKFNS